MFSLRLRALVVMFVAMLCCCGCGPKQSIDTKSRSSKTTISVWHPWGGTQKEQFMDIVNEFNRTHSDIEVKALFTPNDTGSNQKFFTAVAADRAPDVIFVDGTQTSAWAEQGALEPLDKLILQSKIKAQDYFAPSWNQNCYKGHVWALAYCADPNFALVWNKKAFREVGLDPEKPPTTIAELDRYSDRLTKIVNGKIVRLGIIPWAQYGSANSIFTWGWAFGGSFYDSKTGKITANNPKVVEAFKWMMSYCKKYDIRKMNAFASGFGSRDQDPLYTGQLAMRCMYIAGIEDIKEYAPNLDYGIGYIPTPSGGEEHSSWVGGWCLAIPKGCKHPKQAWEFIVWCSHDPVGTSVIGDKQKLFPGYKYSPYLEKVKDKPGYSMFLNILKECKHQRPVMPAQEFFMNSLGKAVDYAAYGRKTPKQALDDATKETQTELDLRLAGR